MFGSEVIPPTGKAPDWHELIANAPGDEIGAPGPRAIAHDARSVDDSSWRQL